MNVLDPRAVRSLILRQSKRANVGHIGSALSIVELLCAVYGSVLRYPSPRDPGRDRFVLSKGHAALALYAVFQLKDWLSERDLDSYCGDETALGVHPERRLSGVDFTTGSMGMGLGFAGGAALAARLQKSDRRAFALISDGECNEGSIWEAAMFAAHHELANLVVLIDWNRQQAFGHTTDVLQLDRIEDRWDSFGWDVHRADGHDVAALENILRRLDYTTGKPHVIIADTICGKGVSYMEGKVAWHYLPMTDDEFRQAITEVGEPST